MAKPILYVEYIDIYYIGALNKLWPNTTSILKGDINIDIIKFKHDETCNYLSTLLSHCYLPYITLPARITTFSATCIGHIFIKPARNNPSLVNDIVCGLLYCDISDHLPCFVSLKSQRAHVMKDRPNTRTFGLTHNLKSYIKKKLKLYKSSVRNDSEDNICKYKRYRNILIRNLKIAEELY